MVNEKCRQFIGSSAHFSFFIHSEEDNRDFSAHDRYKHEAARQECRIASQELMDDIDECIKSPSSRP